MFKILCFNHALSLQRLNSDHCDVQIKKKSNEVRSSRSLGTQNSKGI